MNAAEALGQYAEGWTKGDAQTILGATAPGYVFDDPDAGRIARAAFADYLARLQEAVGVARAGRAHDVFVDLSEVVTQEAGGILTAWCWWAIPGTPIQGSGLIKVGPDGVRSERITYYTALPK